MRVRGVRGRPCCGCASGASVDCGSARGGRRWRARRANAPHLRLQGRATRKLETANAMWGVVDCGLVTCLAISGGRWLKFKHNVYCFRMRESHCSADQPDGERHLTAAVISRSTPQHTAACVAPLHVSRQHAQLHGGMRTTDNTGLGGAGKRRQAGAAPKPRRAESVGRKEADCRHRGQPAQSIRGGRGRRARPQARGPAPARGARLRAPPGSVTRAAAQGRAMDAGRRRDEGNGGAARRAPRKELQG